MDMLVFIILMLLAFAVLRTAHSLIYFVGVTDIFLRVLAFVKVKIPAPQLVAFLDKYMPISIPSMIGKTFSGILFEILIWVYIVCMIIFVIYLIREMFSRR